MNSEQEQRISELEASLAAQAQEHQDRLIRQQRAHHEEVQAISGGYEADLAAQAQEIEKYKALYLEDEQELHEKEQEIEELKAERAESRRWKTLQAKHELEKELAAVRQERDALQAAQQWQSIETAPKLKPVIVYMPFEPVGLIQKARLRDGGWRTYCGEAIEPTHWMPLPAPPVLSSADPEAQ